MPVTERALDVQQGSEPSASAPTRSDAARSARQSDQCFEEGAVVGAHVSEHDRRVHELVGAADLGELSAAVARDTRRRGVSFGSASGEQAFRIDPIPRVIDAPEWQGLADGVAQRVRALELFVKDVYGD